MSIPLTVNGRSPLDGIRLRWAGLACVVLGGMLLFQGPAGIVLGVLAAALGGATWWVTDLGRTPWPALSTPQRFVAGTGSAVGLCMVAFVAAAWVVALFLVRIVQSVLR